MYVQTECNIFNSIIPRQETKQTGIRDTQKWMDAPVAFLTEEHFWQLELRTSISAYYFVKNIKSLL